MKCAVHPELDATGYCRNCGKPMCAACSRPVRDVLYCEDCLAKITGLATPVVPGAGTDPAFVNAPRRGGSHPTAALLLGFVPGLGAIYNGEYNKALIHIVVFAALIVGLNSDLGDGPETAVALLLAGFIFYMALDSMRTAKAKITGEVVADPLESWSKDRPVGPIILIAMGGLFLLNNFGFFSFFQIHRFWPVILIAVGVFMFRNRMGSHF
ncbi:MAG TPA: DUF5668 domain-containing protein [Candidatus Eremiobacteraceae bacterium]|nr:DUF5668 domain-containing protein [Candidatus Eremiobacteraceae bacterium]